MPGSGTPGSRTSHTTAGGGVWSRRSWLRCRFPRPMLSIADLRPERDAGAAVTPRQEITMRRVGDMPRCAGRLRAGSDQAGAADDLGALVHAHVVGKAGARTAVRVQVPVAAHPVIGEPAGG